VTSRFRHFGKLYATQAQSSGASVIIESLSHHREIVLLPEVLEGNIEKLKRVDFEISTFRQALCDAGSIQRSLSNHREPQSPSRASVTIESLSHHRHFGKLNSTLNSGTKSPIHQFTNWPIHQFAKSPTHQINNYPNCIYIYIWKK